MKRISLLTIGFFCTVPSIAFAQTPALSPWVQSVFHRVDQQITEAQATPASSTCVAAVGQAKIESRKIVLARVQDVLRAFKDTKTNVTQEVTALKNRTLCFQSDLDRIEQELEILRKNMLQALDGCKLVQANMLADTYTYLATAYRSLSEGGMDPTYEDPYALAGSGSLPPSLRCPYTSDYSPHALAFSNGIGSPIRSYGCDATVLSTLNGNVTAQNALIFQLRVGQLGGKLYDAMDVFLQNLRAIFRSIRGTLPETEELQPKTPLNPLHATVSGCLALSQSDIDTDTTREYVSEYLDDFSKPANGLFNPLPIGLLFSPAYSTFSLLEDPLSLITQAIDRMRRVYRESAALHEEYLWYLKENNAFFDLNGEANYLTNKRNLGENLGGYMAATESWTTDSLDRTMDAYKPLNEAIHSLADVTKDGGILPLYVRDVAYFLLRSCTGGPCEKKLDTVLQRILNPYCHPFTGTQYTEEKVAEKCYCTDPTLPAYKQYCEK